MDAMYFEYLIRRVYECGRYGAAGADADIFRQYEYAERGYTLDLENILNQRMRISTKPIETLKQEFDTEARNIWRFVQDAIKTALIKFPTVLTVDETEALLNLVTPYKGHPTAINEAIDKANTILGGHKIYPK